MRLHARDIAFGLAFALASATAASAVTGGAQVLRGDGVGRHLVMIVGLRGNLCTATALAQDVLLTAAHCVAPASTYRLALPGREPGDVLRQIAIHPRYDGKHYAAGRVTADVALVRLERPLPAEFSPAPLAPAGNVAPGDRLVVAGYGATRPGSESGIGTARAAHLAVTGKPGNLQVRLVDPATRGETPGLGACTGDSGGPAFREVSGRAAVIGVVSWSTGPAGSAGCGGLTGLTPLTLYRGWIADTLRQWGAAPAR